MSAEIEMIKQGLQKLIDEMDSMETQRILPDGHPSKTPTASDATGIDPTSEPMDPSMSDDGSGSDMDPNVLSQLMDKAGQADDTGSLPEDAGGDLPPEIQAAVADKKKKMMGMPPVR